MNRENIKIVRDAIANDTEDLVFDMEYGLKKDWCGTPGCMAAWAVVIFRNDPRYVYEYRGLVANSNNFYHWPSVSALAGKIMELGEHCRELLFEDFPPYVSRERTVEVLDNLLETGEVDWGDDQDS